MHSIISENQYMDCERYRRLRFLAGSDDEAVRVDYSVLSVGVMTLGLIMIVEVIRHKIDHAAAPRPFSKAVLQGVYSERKSFCDPVPTESQRSFSTELVLT